MKVKELIKQLKGWEDYDILVGSDEELNTLFKSFELNELTDKTRTLVIFGLSGSEVE